MIEVSFPRYTENAYGKNPRITSDEYRTDLTSWQVPAIKKHIGDLTGKVFIDIGAGDIVLGEKLNEIGVPKIFYVQDLNEVSLQVGAQRIAQSGVDMSIFKGIVSDSFIFDAVEDGEIDAAFSNSLFSHLSINSITLCLRNLFPKMKSNSSYFSSMIVLPSDAEEFSYDWKYLGTKYSNVVSTSIRDPYHYTENTIRQLSNLNVGFEVKAIHNYGHPFQKLVEFYRP